MTPIKKEQHEINEAMFDRLKLAIKFHIDRDPNLDEILISYPARKTDKKVKNILKLNVSLGDL